MNTILNVINKIFTSLTKRPYKLECFFRCKPFQPGLIFVGKFWSLPKRGAPERLKMNTQTYLSPKYLQYFNLSTYK